jgi:hypothetical protein
MASTLVAVGMWWGARGRSFRLSSGSTWLPGGASSPGVRAFLDFGLDTDDQITEYGFVDWFTLQHYDRFDGKSIPPLAVVEIEVPFSGWF